MATSLTPTVHTTVIQMTMNQRLNRTITPIFGLWLALLLIPHVATADNETFALVETRTGVYSNVTVTTKSEDYIVIQHATGLTSLKVSDLTPEMRTELGFVTTKSKLEQGSLTITAKARALVDVIPTTEIEEAWNKYAPAGTPLLKLDSTVISIALGVLATCYFGFCLCGSLICQKVGRPAGPLMWIPVLQFIPLFRAAKMSPLWLVAMLAPLFSGWTAYNQMSPLWLLVPLISVCAHILWSCRIAGARGRGWETALLLILPTFPLAFIYLALAGTVSKPAPEEELTPEQIRVNLVLDQS